MLRFAVIGLVCVLALGSCGDSSTSPGDAPGAGAVKNYAVAACLEDAGAQRAARVSDITFFQEAKANGDANLSGFAWARKDRLVVNIWTSPADSSGRHEWILWAAQPFKDYDGSPRSVETLISDSSRPSFVVFATSPDAHLIKRADACLPG